ncbi:hypothetical protein GCM10027590_51840 [Nocardiopsis nanhaiensis]
MTENGGGAPGNRRSEEDADSWFKPSENRFRTQSEYQDPMEQGDGEGSEQGGAPSGDAVFPDSGGYSGLSASRPAMVEPYPEALGGPPTTPPVPPSETQAPFVPGAISYPGAGSEAYKPVTRVPGEPDPLGFPEPKGFSVPEEVSASEGFSAPEGVSASEGFPEPVQAEEPSEPVEPEGYAPTGGYPGIAASARVPLPPEEPENEQSWADAATDTVGSWELQSDSWAPRPGQEQPRERRDTGGLDSWSPAPDEGDDWESGGAWKGAGTTEPWAESSVPQWTEPTHTPTYGGDRYDDELSPPSSAAVPSDEGGIGSGSGNTWAFDRNDPRLPDVVRDAERRRKESAPEVPSFTDWGPAPAEDTAEPPAETDDGPDTGELSAAVATSTDPLAAIADMQSRAKAKEVRDTGDEPVPEPAWGEEPPRWEKPWDEAPVAEPAWGERPWGEAPAAEPAWGEEPPRWEKPWDEAPVAEPAWGERPWGEAPAAADDSWQPEQQGDTRMFPAPAPEEDPLAPREAREPEGYGTVGTPWSEEPQHGWGQESDQAYDELGRDERTYDELGWDDRGPHDRAHDELGYGVHDRGDPGFGRTAYDEPSYGQSSYGEPSYGGAAQGQQPYGEPAYDELGAPAEGRSSIAPGVPSDLGSVPSYGVRQAEPAFEPQPDWDAAEPGEPSFEAEEQEPEYDDGFTPADYGMTEQPRTSKRRRDRAVEDFPGFDDSPLGGDVGDAYPGYDSIDYLADTEPGANVTLWLGVASLIPGVGVITALLALFVTGPKAKKAIGESRGTLDGLGLITTGTVFSVVGIVVTVISVAILLAL